MIAALILCLAPVAVDGDTVKCGATSIRLFGIQAPERGAAGYAASKLHLQGEVSGGLVCESRGASYSRIVATCSNGAGKDMGRVQLDASHAVEWCSYSRNHYGTCP